MYSKEQQLGKRFKPKRKNRTEIKPRDRQLALDYWDNGCIYCQSPNVALHHVKYRSGMGTGRWRNLVPLCQTHHDKVHDDKTIRKSLEMLLEQRFGKLYWADEWDLWDKGLIDHPTVGEYEKYFEGVRENGKDNSLL